MELIKEGAVFGYSRRRPAGPTPDRPYISKKCYCSQESCNPRSIDAECSNQYSQIDRQPPYPTYAVPVPANAPPISTMVTTTKVSDCLGTVTLKIPYPGNIDLLIENEGTD